MVPLSYMFYKTDDTETNLEVIIDLEGIDVNHAFENMFTNNSSNIYNLKVSFPELIFIEGSYCMY